MLTFLAATWGWFFLAVLVLAVLAFVTFFKKVASTAKGFFAKGFEGIGAGMALPFLFGLSAGVAFLLAIIGVIADFAGK